MASLADLLLEYSNQEDPSIQSLVSSLQEFDKLKTLPSEDVPKKGEFYKHQETTKILMDNFDDILLVHDPGTGKSCATTLIAETFKARRDFLRSKPSEQVYDPETSDVFDEGSLSSGSIQRAYIIVKGSSLKREFKNQIVCKCTNGIYETDKVMKASTDKSQKTAVTNSLKPFYTFWTYRKLGKRLKDMTDEDIIQTYSNGLFILDEVHNLRPTGNEIDDSTSVKMQYFQIHRLFHLVKRSKRIIMSATPMIDSVREIKSVMNLILPEDRQIGNIDFRTATIQDLEPYFRGRVSYVRALDTGAKPYYEGEKLKKKFVGINGEEEEAQTIVYNVEMSPFQTSGYYNVEEKVVDYDDVLEELKTSGDVEKQNNAFHQGGRQASNITYPVWDSINGVMVGIGGEEGFRSVIDEVDKEYTVKPEYVKYFKDKEQVRVMSAKGAAILDIIEKTDGIVYIFSPYVSGSGAIGLSKIIEHSGFENFNQETSAFSSNVKGNQTRPFCSSEDTSTRSITIEKKQRYSLFTSKTPDSRVDKIFEVLNSPENVLGEYIKVFIGSNVARDGININHVRAIILLGPEWNPSPMIQAENRGLRSTSHVQLLELLNKTSTTGDVKLNIPIYRMSAITPDGASLDDDMYYISETKEREIRKIMRMMKIMAVDCHIHKNRNQRPDDKPGSPICDYTSCEFECFDQSLQVINESNYIVIESEKNIKILKKQIRDFFSVNFSTTIEELYSLFDDFLPEYVNMAVNSIVQSGETIINRMGFLSFIQEIEGVIFISHTYHQNSSDEVEYTSRLFSLSSSGISTEVDEIQQTEKIKTIEEIFLLEPTSELFLSKFNILDLESKANLVETAKIQVDMGAGGAASIEILNKYRNQIFSVEKDEQHKINMDGAEKLVNPVKDNRGRPSTNPNKPKDLTNVLMPSYIISPTTTNPDKIYFHTVLNLGGLTAQAATAFWKVTKTIRVLHEGVWKNATDVESVAYQAHYKLERENIDKEIMGQRFYELTRDNIRFIKNTKFPGKPIYGNILSDGNFRIRDADIEGNTTDGRNVNRSIMCTSKKVNELVNIAWRSGITGYDGVAISNPEDKLKSKGFNVDMMTEEEINFYYNFSVMDKKDLCNILLKFFEDNGLMYYSVY
jgi:superfamily II DNA or RNA helicase